MSINETVSVKTVMSINETVDEFIKGAREKIIVFSDTSDGAQEISGGAILDCLKDDYEGDDKNVDDEKIMSAMSMLYEKTLTEYSKAKAKIDIAWMDGELGDPVELLGYRDRLKKAESKLRETIEESKPKMEEVEKKISELKTQIINEAKKQTQYDVQHDALVNKLRQVIEKSNRYEGRPELTQDAIQTKIERIEREVRGEGSKGRSEI